MVIGRDTTNAFHNDSPFRLFRFTIIMENKIYNKTRLYSSDF
jgi:hypothetical protein